MSKFNAIESMRAEVSEFQYEKFFVHRNPKRIELSINEEFTDVQVDVIDDMLFKVVSKNKKALNILEKKIVSDGGILKYGTDTFGKYSAAINSELQEFVDKLSPELIRELEKIIEDKKKQIEEYGIDDYYNYLDHILRKKRSNSSADKGS